MGNIYTLCCNHDQNLENNVFQLNINPKNNKIIINFNNLKNSATNNYEFSKNTNNSHIHSEIENKKKSEQVKNTFQNLDKESCTSRSFFPTKKNNFLFYFNFLKENGIFLNLKDFFVEENIFNTEKKLNKFTSTLIVEKKNSLSNLKEDQYLSKLISELDKSIIKKQKDFDISFNNSQFKTKNKTNFFIKKENDFNISNEITNEKNLFDSIFDLNSYFPDKENTRFNLFPVYSDMVLKDKIFQGEWVLNFNKYDDILKNKTVNIMHIEKLTDIFDFEGWGMLIKKNCIFEGFFKKNSLNGPGRIIINNGDVYKGLFSNGILNGSGIYENSVGNRYEGEFKNSKMEGLGIEYFVDGSIFEGIYFQNKKNGIGKFNWVDGSEYEGYVLNNEINGLGIFKWPKGIVYNGEWVKGKMHGMGTFTYPSGEFYEGYFENNKKHGKGKYFWRKEKYYVGNWSDNLQNGEGFFRYDNKEIKGIWENGILIKKL